MEIKGLFKVRGRSFEEIVNILDSGGLVFEVTQKPIMKEGFFRTSYICVNNSGKRVVELLGEGLMNGRARSYQAEYEIGPGFDVGQLTGRINFRKGKLLERVRIHT
jgi:hypothetical protein